MLHPGKIADVMSFADFGPPIVSDRRCSPARLADT
jgi:hypothetical protein